MERNSPQQRDVVGLTPALIRVMGEEGTQPEMRDSSTSPSHRHLLHPILSLPVGTVAGHTDLYLCRRVGGEEKNNEKKKNK